MKKKKKKKKTPKKNKPKEKPEVIKPNEDIFSMEYGDEPGPVG